MYSVVEALSRLLVLLGRVNCQIFSPLVVVIECERQWQGPVLDSDLQEQVDVGVNLVLRRHAVMQVEVHGVLTRHDVMQFRQ